MSYERVNFVDTQAVVACLRDLDDRALACFYRTLGECAEHMNSAGDGIDSSRSRQRSPRGSASCDEAITIFSDFGECLLEARSRVVDEARKRLDANTFEDAEGLRQIVIAHLVDCQYPDDDLILAIIETSKKTRVLGELS